MYLGVDLGTSAIKLVLMDEQNGLLDSRTAPLSVSRPKPLWSEQDPAHWWQAFCECMDALKVNNDLAPVQAIGLSGQMHGATLIDSKGDVIRPAILWNDGRCQAECEEIEQQQSEARMVTGNIIMPGFTAPKLKWLQKHEPENFARLYKVLLPKDYLRFLLSGDFASDMSDAAGSMWLDVQHRRWHQGLLETCGLSEENMPLLYEGNQITGHLKAELARSWGMHAVPIVAGAGDNAGGAIGVGMVNPGQGMLSLGTSGVYFVVSDGFSSNPDSAVHSFCHALPNTWHLMSVHLSAASCLQWYADSIAKRPVADLLSEMEQADIDPTQAPIFLPYLSGERTPHNNPNAKGSLFGLTHATDQAAATHAVLEGVSLAFADGVDALHQSGLEANQINLIGGGARSTYWRQMLADVLNRPIYYRQGGDMGPALGAARLAQLGVNPSASIADICPQPPLEKVYQPRADWVQMYRQRRNRFQLLYRQLSALF